MAQAWLDARLPVASCEHCGGMADGQGMCLVRCDRQPVRPAVTLAMVLGAVMTI